jgi:hypothetical protein
MNTLIQAEDLKATGQVHIQVFDAAGNLKEEHKVKNLVVTVGKQHIAAKIAATTNSPASMTHMAIGSGSGTPAAGDTQLGTELGRVGLTGGGGSVSTNTITYTATFPAGTGTSTSPGIQEAGIFNASSSGTLLCRTTFPSVAKASGDSIAVTWVVTVS